MSKIIRHGRADCVAESLYPNDSPCTHEPARMGGDSNFVFRAISMSSTGREDDHSQLLWQAAEQLCNKLQAIAGALIGKALSFPGVSPSVVIGTLLPDQSCCVAV